METSLKRTESSQNWLSLGDLSKSYDDSVEEIVLAENAFFDKSLLELLYFPDDQKYAIYIPYSIYGIRLTPKIRGTPDFRGRGPRNQGYLFAKMLKLTNVKCQKILKYAVSFPNKVQKNFFPSSFRSMFV